MYYSVSIAASIELHTDSRPVSLCFKPFLCIFCVSMFVLKLSEKKNEFVHSFTISRIPSCRLCKGSNTNNEYNLLLRGTWLHWFKKDFKLYSKMLLSICFPRFMSFRCSCLLFCGLFLASFTFSYGYILTVFVCPTFLNSQHQRCQISVVTDRKYANG